MPQNPMSCEPFLDEIVRDRLVLYLRALRVPPEVGLRFALSVMQELATEELAKKERPLASSSPEDAVLRGGMSSLKRRLAEAGCALSLLQEEGRAFSSVPSYNRGSMPPAIVASRMKLSMGYLRGQLRRLLGLLEMSETR